MQQLLFIETGTGLDVHGQDVTVAAKRAVEDAVHYNSMPGIAKILPEQNLDHMQVNVKLAIPADKEKLDQDTIQSMIPYGKVTIEVVDGGMATTSGIFLEEQQDKSDLMYIVNAVIEVGY